MAGTKKPTHVVRHKKLYMAHGGKIQLVKQGTPVVLSAAVAKGLGNKVAPISEGKTLDLTKESEAEPEKTS